VIERKKTLNVFKDAHDAWGSFDDFPVGQPGTDPMPHLSRNRCAQPFFLVAEADHVLVQMAGSGRIELRGHATMQLEPGDTVYIPACVPSRIIPDGENIQIADLPEAFAEHCIALLNDAEARRKQSQAAWEMVSACYSWDVVSRKFEQLLA